MNGVDARPWACSPFPSIISHPQGHFTYIYSCGWIRKCLPSKRASTGALWRSYPCRVVGGKDRCFSTGDVNIVTVATTVHRLLTTRDTQLSVWVEHHGHWNRTRVSGITPSRVARAETPAGVGTPLRELREPTFWGEKLVFELQFLLHSHIMRIWLTWVYGPLPFI